jgi:hypothetical protein
MNKIPSIDDIKIWNLKAFTKEELLAAADNLEENQHYEYGGASAWGARCDKCGCLNYIGMTTCHDCKKSLIGCKLQMPVPFDNKEIEWKDTGYFLEYEGFLAKKYTKYQERLMNENK